MLCCCTGMRISEALNALPHIDFESNMIKVVDEDTKTKKHKRHIPFLPDLINKDKQKLLLSITSRHSASHYFRDFFKELGIEATLHSFRVTFISCCNHLNINPKQIQAWAGHSSITMTYNTYVRLLDKKDGTSPILEYLRRLKEEFGV